MFIGESASVLASETARQYWQSGSGNDQRNGLRRLHHEGDKTHQHEGEAVRLLVKFENKPRVGGRVGFDSLVWNP